MSDIKKLFKHSSNYFLGQILLMMAGFISFPLYTRILSIRDYGYLGLITTTIMLIVVVSKLGLQHSIVRFYSDFASYKNEKLTTKFYSTYYISIIFFGGLASFVFFLTIKIIPKNLIEDNLKKLFELTSILVLFTCSLQILSQIFRAEQRPNAYNLLNILSRYGNIFFNVIFFICFGRILYSFVLGSVIWQGVLFSLLSFFLFKTYKIHIKNFSSKLFKDSLKYGIPLIGVELSHLILNSGDRYIIQYYLGPVSLGIYSAGYAIATYAAELIILPIRDAVFPIYMDIYANKGEKETKIFLGKSLKYFSMVAIPMIFGFIAVSSDLIILLASKKYIQSYVVAPYVLTGMIIYGTWSFFGAGLFINKNTIKILVFIIIACCLNIIINIILIPKFGIIGAAIATLIAYSFYIFMLIIFSFRKFEFQIEYKNIFLYFISSIVMFVAIFKIDFNNSLINLTIKIIIGVAIYFLGVSLFDREIRNKFFKVIKTFSLYRKYIQ